MWGDSGKSTIGWTGNVRHRILSALAAGSVLLALVVACGGENSAPSSPSPATGPASQAAAPTANTGAATTIASRVPAGAPTPNTTASNVPTPNLPTVIPTAASEPPTATPAPRVFTGPVAASNIPFPTYATSTPRPLATRAPTPTAIPTPTPGPAQEIMDGARNLMAVSSGVAFEVTATLAFDSGSGSERVSVTYAGDFRPGYNSADLTVTSGDGTEEFREISSNLGFGRITQVFETRAATWEPYFDRPPYFVDLPKLFGLDERSLSSLALQGETNVGGASYQVLHAVIRGLEIGGGQGDVDAVFRIDISDGFLREVVATGTLEFARESALLGDTGGKTATVRLAARLFDYGKTVPVITPELALPLFEHQAISLDDGRVLVGSGFTGVANNDFIAPFPSAAVQVCDAIRKECTLVESSVPPGLMYSLVMLADGRVLAVGLGSMDGTFVNANLFDPRTSSWTVLPSAPRDRALPDLVLLEDGRVAVVGGLEFSASSSPGVFREVDVFDPSTQTWQEAAPMTRAFLETESGPLVITLEDGRIVAMGETEDGLGSRVAFAEVYDPGSDAWRTVDGLDEFYPVIAGARLLDGTVLALGGPPLIEIEFINESGSQLSADEKNARVEARFPHAKKYDPVTNAWTPAGGMQHPRTGATLTLLSDGRVLVAGGTAREISPFERGEGELVPFTEIYNPATNSWSLGPQLEIPRANHAATALSDGRVLLTGGIGMEPNSGERFPLSSVELLDPTAAQ